MFTGSDNDIFAKQFMYSYSITSTLFKINGFLKSLDKGKRSLDFCALCEVLAP